MVEQFRMPEPPFVIQERRDIPHMDVVRASDYAALEALCAAKDKVIYEIDFATVPKLTDRIAALEAAHERNDKWATEHVAALEARCRDLTDELAAYRAMPAKLPARIATLEDTLRWIKGECMFACGRPDGFDLRKNLGEISHRASLAINGSEKETSPEPNYRFQEPSNLPSQSMTIGAHPGGGPCIHVWALTNRSAVENGKCELCGNSVPNRGVK